MKTFTDLAFKPHSIGAGTQARLELSPQHTISVVFGSTFYSNGVNTYEAWIDTIDENPRGHLTTEEVTAYMAEAQEAV